MKLCYLVWIDAASSDPWESLEEAKNHGLHEIHSLGFVVHEDEHKITLCLSHDRTGDAVSQMLAVPIQWIKFKKYLRTKISL